MQLLESIRWSVAVATRHVAPVPAALTHTITQHHTLLREEVLFSSMVIFDVLPCATAARIAMSRRETVFDVIVRQIELYRAKRITRSRSMRPMRAAREMTSMQINLREICPVHFSGIDIEIVRFADIAPTATAHSTAPTAPAPTATAPTAPTAARRLPTWATSAGDGVTARLLTTNPFGSSRRMSVHGNEPLTATAPTASALDGADCDRADRDRADRDRADRGPPTTHVGDVSRRRVHCAAV
jgi:hypothetical protein